MVKHHVRRGAISLIVAALAGAIGPSGPRAAELAEPQTTPLDIVVAVDESGSLGAADVAKEVEAASTIAQSGLNPRTRVTVLGFGSSNAAGQVAVREVCRPTVTSGETSRQYLSECVNGLHRRADGEGDDTDHAAALTQALSYFGGGSPAGSVKAIFLLTDGRLDVRRSPQWGSGDRNAAADREIDRQLSLARDQGVQVWPLGFGGDIDRTRLAQFATAGSQQGCDRRVESRPRAVIRPTSTELVRTLQEAYAAATCAGLTPPETGELAGGETRELKLRLPAIATDGLITVSKGDPRIRVRYLDPRGKEVPASGELDGSRFERSGENGGTEALRIVDPRPGTWTVRLTAPQNLKRQLVSAAALWQGAARTAIVVEPPSARTGQQMTVRLTLQTRRGAITDPEALRNLGFAVLVSGAGLAAPQNVPVADDGKAPDDRAGDGSYAGGFAGTNAEGVLTFQGTVSGPGVNTEQVPVSVQVTATGPVIQGRIAFAGGTTVHPGDRVQGTVAIDNGGNPTQARLVLDGPPDARATIVEGGTFPLPSGSTDHQFTIAFGGSARLGGTSLTVRVVDAANPATVYANGLLTVTVDEPPGLLERLRWVLLGLLALVALCVVAFLLRRAAQRRAQDVRGLFARLLRDDEPVGAELKAPPGRWSKEFRFVIRDLDDAYPRLDYPRPDERPYVARRGPEGRVLVHTPNGDRYDITPGRGEPLSNGLVLGFRDLRPPHRRVPGPRHPQQTSAAPAGPAGPTRTGSTQTPADDPWV